MVDTWRKTDWGIFEGEECSDCSGKEVVIKHNGHLVPKGEIGRFCFSCWGDRQKDYNEGLEIRLLGIMREKTATTS
ncbi:MAG: hypothetical protein A2430_00250 [Candidatus Liptonbacteria bacterium RIFOXYC1_FULL_36_8]|uniref:Uncharacterized protein n=3 Tax=Candidatus Liptoniibacteriota TaxID=1817909 RepID=A0A1G2CN36_9BACT|nr:MAG: hypothetical protein A2390_02185 [Candidatus Liptonbacteria bacterium RIFOXYB1_FULL_36_10]OGZ03040.1 MAG: hypothetical protein A2604_01020 [Candidatus Liptonbacteria bacterium RIFOXYD1_FULL_36_11]OGZ03065.1 MAG: hypothetical protein A2430_00250 [Candidatus Liptonbacteria bacterium RIFOXYC1_FULL_36_8]